MPEESDHLSITVDKSHIITIGERLYEQSIELIRELVNNANDADATRVDVSLMKDPGNPREAYNRQSKLLRDAFRDEDEKSDSKKKSRKTQR